MMVLFSLQQLDLNCSPIIVVSALVSVVSHIEKI
jgi:hypothetical protein